MITIIVAIAENGAIGYKNELLYRISADLKRFKTLTTGHTVLMGRKTFLSLPKGALPNRRNMVLTRDVNAQFPGTETFVSIEDALAAVGADEQVFVIGGAQIYKQVMAYADKLYITEVAASFPDADVFFPEIDKALWREVSRQDNPADEKHAYAYSFVVYEKVE
jgi:dihydrofolate reductase